MRKSKDKEVVKKDFTIEELVKFIREDPEMQKPPKKRLSLITKLIIVLIIALIIFIWYFLFVWKPFVYTILFNENSYEIYGYTFETKSTGEVVYGAMHIDTDENIVKILPYTNYNDLDCKYIVMLSEYGNIYNYNINKDVLYKYEKTDLNVLDMSTNTMDIYSVIEVEFENTTKRILGQKKLIDYSIDEIKLMDRVLYKKDKYVVYSFKDNIYLCDYNKVRHFSMETEEFYAESLKNSKCFTSEDGKSINYIDAIVKEANNEIYVYGITDDKNLTIYNFALDDKSYDLIPDKVVLDKIKFNKKLEKFDTMYQSNNSVRIYQENEDRKIEVYLDVFAFGAISKDASIFTYVSDLKDMSKYTIVQGGYGNCKYEGNYYTLIEKKFIKCVFKISDVELGIVIFDLKDVSYVYDSIKLKQNNSIEEFFEKEGKIYIKVKEVIENNYVVFDSNTEINYHEYLLSDYINK